MIIKDVVLYKTNKCNKNGFYIPHDVIKESILNTEHKIFVTISDDARETTDLTEISHECINLTVDDDKNEIRCDTKILDTPKGKILKDNIDTLVPNAVSVCDLGTGKDSKVIKTHKLIAVNYVNK